jgi:hypothetical protein
MKMGGSHRYFVKPEYIPALEEVCLGSSIEFYPVDHRPSVSLDTWIANGFLADRGVHFWNQEDIIFYLQTWFNNYGGFCGMPCPVYHERKDMLWDAELFEDADVRECDYDVLLINSQPTSGQCLGYSQEEVDELGAELRRAGNYVLFAQYDGVCPYTLAELGKLSWGARLIIGTANGPLWPCYNSRTMEKDRIVFLSPMYLDYGLPGRTLHANTASEAREHCKTLNYL